MIMIKYLKCVFFRELLNVLTDDEIRDILQLKIASIAKPVQVKVVFIQILKKKIYQSREFLC